MEKLSETSRDLAIRILTEVDFDNRFTGGRLRERAGILTVTMYSFKEVVDLLNDPMPLLNFNELEKWVRDVMGDDELAERIATTAGQESNQFDRESRVKELMEERLTQCRKMV